MRLNPFLVAQEVAPGVGEGTGAAAKGQGLMGMPLLMMALIFGIMWFFLILPQQRREKERRKLLESLTKGDRVITQGGLYGTIVALNEKTIVLRVSDEPLMKMEFARGAVSQVAVSADAED